MDEAGKKTAIDNASALYQSQINAIRAQTPNLSASNTPLLNQEPILAVQQQRATDAAAAAKATADVQSQLQFQGYDRYEGGPYGGGNRYGYDN